MDSPPTIAWRWSWAIFQYIPNPCRIPGAAFKKIFKLIPVHDPKGRRCFLEVVHSWNCCQAGHMLSADPGHQPRSGRWREFPPALPRAPHPQVNLWSRCHWTVIDAAIVNAPLYGWQTPKTVGAKPLLHLFFKDQASCFTCKSFPSDVPHACASTRNFGPHLSKLKKCIFKVQGNNEESETFIVLIAERWNQIVKYIFL